MQVIICMQILSPLCGMVNIEDDSMTVNNFFHEAVVSIWSHFSSIALQQGSALNMWSYSIILSLSLVRPSNVPITLHCVEYCGVKC